MSISAQINNIPECKNLEFGFITTPDTLSCVEYSYNSRKRKLTMNHINAGFNCCPGSLHVQAEMKGDTIQILEFEKEAGCRCLCLFDLDIEIIGVERQKYQIQLIEPYVAEDENIAFEINLNDNPHGTYCVTRKKHPWGDTAGNASR
jgi:hypothetical protein